MRISSGYAYLSVLNEIHDMFLEMLGREEFTKEQLVKLLPLINLTNEVMNANVDSLNEYSLNVIKRKISYT